MAQIKFSQKAVQGLPESLTNIISTINTNNTTTVTALTSLQTVLDTVNGDSTVSGSFRKAIADLVGAAPEALNTLKEIADYISVNPDANVAAAINAALSAAQQAIADEKTFLNNYMNNFAFNFLSVNKSATVVTGSKIYLTDATASVEMWLNNGIGHVIDTTTNITYQAPIANDASGHYLDLTGYEAEFPVDTVATVKAQYIQKYGSTYLRSTNGNLA